MASAVIRDQVVWAVGEIQEQSGRAYGHIDGTTRPMGGLEDFDSLNWLEALALLSSVMSIDFETLRSELGARWLETHKSFTINDVVNTIERLVR